MSPRPPCPPALSRRALSWAARGLGTPELVDDAAELFAARARTAGETAARRWYRRQAAAAVVRRLLPGGSEPGKSPGRAGLAGLALDAKLGGRMLARYPGLTVVGGLAMAFAIFVGAGLFEFVGGIFPSRSLPLPQGERVVGVRYWDRAANERALPGPSDLGTWREELRTLELLGGFHTIERGLGVGAEGGRPLEVARMSPVGFRIAEARPLLGRTLGEKDAEPGAPPVVVLGYRAWRDRLGADPAAVGRTVRLGDVRATVVGVMPEGFRFPLRHEVWVPLPRDGADADAPTGVRLYVFGRLVPGATLEDAQAEARAVTARAALLDPETDAHLDVQVLPYRTALFSLPVTLVLRALVYQINGFAALFLLLVAANVALLMYARAAARERELLVRAALGASRGRVVAQLFVEALVLTGLAAGAALAATGPGLAWLERRMGEMGAGTPPFWWDAGVSATTAGYAAALAILAAVVAGVVPALQVTRGDLDSRLRGAGAGGGGLRLGRLWNAIVVLQVATTVVFSAGAYLMVRQAARSGSVEARFAAAQYLAGRLRMDGEGERSESAATEAEFQRRYGEHLRELERRVDARGAVAGTTVADRLPLSAHPTRFVEVEGVGAPEDPASPGQPVATSRVAPDFFAVFGAPVVAGRGFTAADLAEDANPVVVDRSFAERILGGRSAVGRRLRYVEEGRPAEDGPWHEIVGVVADLVPPRPRSLAFEAAPEPHVYHPLDPVRASAYPLYFAARVPGGADALVTTIHRTVTGVSPALRVHDLQTMDRIRLADAAFWQLWADLVLGVSAVALFLSLAGIYAVMSFTVTRRTREIGVRIALGARALRVVADVFRGPLRRVATGVAGGCLVLAVLVPLVTEGGVTVIDGARLVAWCAGVTAVCALACVVPALRALRVEPVEALGADG